MNNSVKRNIKFVSEIFLNRSLAFLYNLEKFTEDPSEENLHQSRVSGRKLESLFDAFGHLSCSDHKTYAKQISDIIKLLSLSREADVCISLMIEYMKQIKVDNLVIRNLLNHLIRNSKLQRKKIFKNNKISDFLNSKEAFEKFIRHDMFTKNVCLSIDDARNYTWLIIPKLYDKVFEYKDVVINNPSLKKKLHRMRLKAKPLRYLVELSDEVFNCNLSDLFKQIKEFVEQAGLIHDFDMLIQKVNKFSELIVNLKSKEKILSKDKSLKVLVKYLNIRRKEEYESFIKMIYKMESDNVKERLVLKLKNCKTLT